VVHAALLIDSIESNDAEATKPVFIVKFQSTMRLLLPLPSALQTALSRLSTLIQNQTQHSYQPVNDEDEKTTTTHYGRLPYINRLLATIRTPQRYILTILTLITLLLTVIYTTSTWPPRNTGWQPNRHQNHMLRLLIPSAVADSESCKTLATAIALGYPVPDVVNYNMSLDEPGQESERERARIRILADFLGRIPSDKNDDVVVILETPFSWVQLRAEVLLERFYAINHDANARLGKLHGFEDVTTRGVVQKVILSGQWHTRFLTLDSDVHSC
jgi:hypothetical protein